MINKSQIQKKKSLAENGFTLIELMVVVGIIALVAGLTIGEINSDSYQLKSRAHTLKAHMTQAKLEAVKRNIRVKVKINGAHDGYSIESIDAGNTVVDIISTVQYTNKFTFTTGNVETIFTPRGTANSNSISVVGKGTSNPEYTIYVNNIGRVRLEKTKN